VQTLSSISTQCETLVHVYIGRIEVKPEFVVDECRPYGIPAVAGEIISVENCMTLVAFFQCIADERFRQFIFGLVRIRKRRLPIQLDVSERRHNDRALRIRLNNHDALQILPDQESVRSPNHHVIHRRSIAVTMDVAFQSTHCRSDVHGLPRIDYVKSAAESARDSPISKSLRMRRTVPVGAPPCLLTDKSGFMIRLMFS